MATAVFNKIRRIRLIASPPGQEDKGKPDSAPAMGAEAENAARHTALYDPDTVHPERMAHDGSRQSAPPATAEGAETAGGGASLYSAGEKSRAVRGLSSDAIKRIADRAERGADGSKARKS